MEEVIRQGVAAGEFVDPHPDRTAKYFMAMGRAVMLYGSKITEAKDLAGHIGSTLLGGIAVKKSS
jgi:hypothetical protein